MSILVWCSLIWYMRIAVLGQHELVTTYPSTVIVEVSLLLVGWFWCTSDREAAREGSESLIGSSSGERRRWQLLRAKFLHLGRLLKDHKSNGKMFNEGLELQTLQERCVFASVHSVTRDITTFISCPYKESRAESFQWMSSLVTARGARMARFARSSSSGKAADHVG
ncbi:hypothetical protein BDZ89DRAFT_1044545 [Hymenopellis radicata]|nr:hypothetical protein BDZ89DRAFT_1044545 [Hymenopellis radicata]